MLPAVGQDRTVPGARTREVVPSLAQRSVVEGIGTALLLAVVVGSGIMAERLAAGNEAVVLLTNSLATGAGLIALISAFAGFSGCQLNPAVTLADALLGHRPWSDVVPYVMAQAVGAVIGVMAAALMFGERLIALSSKTRGGFPLMVGEAIATFGLLAVIFVAKDRGTGEMALAVGSYIMAAYWFTSSTSFANPAVTIARSLTNTFTGIRPTDVPGFLLGEGIGLIAFVRLARWLLPPATRRKEERV